MINIGENIRRLRRERGLTQETLAEFLGVTFQSVSKWERGDSYPDISLLPSIASFFGVTADEVLGIHDKEKEKKIREYIDEYNDLRMKNSPYVFEQISKAVREFPGDYDLLVRYLEMLISEKSAEDSDGGMVLDEVEAIYDKILRYCTDDQIRIQAKRLVCMYYNTLSHTLDEEKFNRKKMEIADEMPNMINSKEHIMTVMNLPEQEHFSACRKAFESEMLLILGTANMLVNYKNKFPLQKKIKVIEKILGIFDDFYDDGNYGQCYRSVIFALGDLGRCYFENGNEEKALFYLRKCAETARKHDELPSESVQRSLFMDGAIYKKTKYGKTMCERMKNNFIDRYTFSDSFKASKEFSEILEILG